MLFIDRQSKNSNLEHQGLLKNVIRCGAIIVCSIVEMTSYMPPHQLLEIPMQNDITSIVTLNVRAPISPCRDTFRPTFAPAENNLQYKFRENDRLSFRIVCQQWSVAA